MIGNFIIWTNRWPKDFRMEGFFFVEGDIIHLRNWSSSAWRAKHYMTAESAIEEIEKLKDIGIEAFVVDIDAVYKSLQRIRENRI